MTKLITKALDFIQKLTAERISLKVSGIYFLSGMAWILVSDILLAILARQEGFISYISIFKGMAYVIVTGLIIYRLVYSSMKKVKAAELKMMESYEEIKAANHELAKSKEFNTIIIEKMLNGFALHKIVLDKEGNPCDYEYIDVNPAFEEFTGMKKEDVIGKRYREIVPNSHLEQTDWVKIYGEVAMTGKPVQITEHTIVFDKWVAVNAYSPQREYFITVFNDITHIKKAELELRDKNEEITALYEELVASEEELREQYDELTLSQKKLMDSEERYRLAVNGSNDIIWDIDFVEQKYFISERGAEMFGIDKESLNNMIMEWHEYIHPDDTIQTIQTIKAHIEGTTPCFRCELRIKGGNGKYRWYVIRGQASFDKDGNPIRMAGSLTDIDEKNNYEIMLQENYKELQLTYKELSATQDELKKQYHELEAYQKLVHHSAHHDSLTGLPNRLSLYEKMEKGLQSDPDHLIAIIFIDSDNFKLINDTMGHSFGDQLIISIGRRISSLTSGHSLHRLGGDEFVVYCSGFQQISDVLQLAESIIKSFGNALRIGDSILHTTVSIGISVFPEHGRTPDELLQSADIAMYKAKMTGKNKYVIYDLDMKKLVYERMTIGRCLHNALERKEFLLYYQPQIDIRTGQITGFEALLRWNSPDLGFVPPMKFISIAEETQLIIPIGKWVLYEACHFLRELQLKGYDNLVVAVNISILQLLQDNFVETILTTLEQTGLNPSCLELEITESILMESFNAVTERLHRLRCAGVKIALDDFGQGYSSLGYLKQLPIHTLKIDKTFIDGIRTEEADRNLTGSIVVIGRKMGLTIIAEGVEYREQLDYLKKHKCQKVQGYYFSKPLPHHEAVAFYENNRNGLPV